MNSICCNNDTYSQSTSKDEEKVLKSCTDGLHEHHSSPLVTGWKPPGIMPTQ